MKTHLVCERDVGLFSLVQQVIAHIPWAARAGRIPIVFFEGRCCYWLPEGYRGRSTVWEYYFEALDPRHTADSIPPEVRSALAERFPDPRDVGYALNATTWVSNHFGDHARLKGRTLAIPYGWRDPDARLRERAAAVIGRHIRPRAYLAEKVEAFWDEHMAGRRVVGVHMRGTDAVSSGEGRAHRRDSLVLESYREEVGRRLTSAPDTRIFVASDDQRSLDFMIDAFGDRVVACDSYRHDSGEVAGRGPTGSLMPAYVARDRALAARNGEEAVIEYLLLARCALLVHNGSSLARTALLHNPALPHVNTHRKNKLLAHAQTFSLSKLRRAARRGLRLAGSPRGRPSPDA